MPILARLALIDAVELRLFFKKNAAYSKTRFNIYFSIISRFCMR